MNGYKTYTPYRRPFYAAGSMLASRIGGGSGTQRNIQYRSGDALTMTQTKTKRRYGRKTFKDMVYNVMSARHATGEQGLTMTHNTLYTLNVTGLPVQGDTDATRDGDGIVLCGLKLKGFYNTDTASSGYGFRIIVGYSGEEYTNTTFASGLGIGEIFLPNTASNVTDCGQINPKAFTVLHDEKFTLNSTITGVRDRVDFAINVPLANKKFLYQSTGSRLGKDKNLYVVVVGDIIPGVTGTTPIGGTTITWDFIYKNSN